MATIPDNHLPRFAAAISGLRFVSYTGCLKTARAALKFDDEKIPADVDPHYVCRSCGAAVQRYLLEWSGNGYVRVAVPDYKATEHNTDIPDKGYPNELPPEPDYLLIDIEAEDAEEDGNE